jgi:hypothetical protein
MDALGRKACGATRTVKPCGPGTPMLVLSRPMICDFGLAAETPEIEGDGG